VSVPELISTAQELSELLAKHQPSLCAIDTEADSLHRYKESLCLIQFAQGEDVVLIDPLAIQDTSQLGDFLGGSGVWMHGADYDMTMLRREYGVLPPVVYDTQIGARLLGEKKFGLGDLVERYFGVVLSKTSQKADWGKRPLSEKMISYALNDVRYLLPMGQMISDALHEKGRYGWFMESCENARQKVLERESGKEDPWRIQGSGRLDPKGLQFLKSLWYWRDKEASIWDRPSFMVSSNKQLLEWCQVLAAGRKIDLPPFYRSDRRQRLFEALKEASSIPSSEWPEKPRGMRRKRDQAFDQRLAELLKKRDRLGEELEIESSLIVARAVMESIVAEEVDPEDVLMAWQRELLSL
jgi:ribonuclease D